MNDEYVSYALLFMALFPLVAWINSWMTGTATELFVVDDNEANRGDGAFEGAQSYRLLFAGICVATGVYGLTVGFE